MAGLLINVEGLKGAGKTTQALLLKQYLDEKGYKSIVISEPSRNHLHAILNIAVKYAQSVNFSDTTKLFLASADRLSCIEESIIPALNKGWVVICDNLIDIEYLGVGYNPIAAKFSHSLASITNDTVKPDLTFFLDVGMEDLKERGENHLFEKMVDNCNNDDIKIYHNQRQSIIDLSSESKKLIMIQNNKSISDIGQSIAKEFTSWIEETKWQQRID